jgi:hypothetical protein
VQQQPQYAQPQYTPVPAPVVPEYKQPETTPWPPPEERTGMPVWLKAVLAFAGVLAILVIANLLMGSHGSSSAKDAAKSQTANPLQKDIEVVGVRIVNDGQSVKFLVVNHSGVEISDLAANVTLWSSTQRSDEDSVGSFTFHADSLAPNESKELTAPLKTEKKAFEMPDWRNITADVQMTSPQQ